MPVKRKDANFLTATRIQPAAGQRQVIGNLKELAKQGKMLR
jgi:hypothetical protein